MRISDRRFPIAGWKPAVVFSAALIAACDRSPKSSSNPTTRTGPVATAVIGPATTQSLAREPSYLMIDQQRYEFPPALLQLRQRDGKLDVVLLSDDPKEAISSSYHGNSFYLQIPAEATDVKDLSSSPWRFTATSNERSDSPDGIFLDGNRLQLQPGDVSVRIEGDPPTMTIWLTGNFQLFDTHDDKVPARTVPVTGTLNARVK